MADLTGYNKVFASDTTTVDTIKGHPLGTRAYDKDGNEYIYLMGEASAVAGWWDTFDEAHLTTKIAGDSKGRVAIAMATIAPSTSASAFGWFQIYGKNTIALAAGGIAADSPLYLSASSGRVDDANVAGDLINGAVSRSAVTNMATPFTVEISYPFVNDAADN